MQFNRSRSLVLPMLMAILLAAPGWLLAEGSTNAPDMERFKQLRQLQNQHVQMQNIKADAQQVNASPEQARMLRLNDALEKFKREKAPELTQAKGLNLRAKHLQIPAVSNTAAREVIFNHGALANRNDSLYFNFFTGTNSADSIGMDVRITGNEGTNFGNEYASWGDPSMLFFYNPMGNLMDVQSVPAVDDPTAVWTTISWDWQGGNNGQPLAVGNIWIVYTRTTHMYVALEVTYVDTWNQYFEFDYMIQTDGSTLFDGTPSLVDISVNGLDGDTLSIGSNPFFEISLGNSPYGDLMVFWDANHNGVWDEEEDMPIEMYNFMDNDMHDENPADGIFSFTYTDEMADGLNYLADDLLFVVFNSMSFASVPVQFYTVPGAFSVSGYTYSTPETLPTGGIVVWAVYDWHDSPSIVGISDPDGYYHLDLPDSGYVMVGSEDYFGMTNGEFPMPDVQAVMVMGHETDINFYYAAPLGGVEGTVRDENGNPIPDVQVMAHRDGPSHSAWTDENGYYFIGLNPGEYDLEVDWSSLPEPYVVPFGQWLAVGDLYIPVVDWTLHSINSSISGHVYLDGNPLMNTMVVGVSYDLGYSVTMTGEFGDYMLPVHGNNDSAFYDLFANMYDAYNIIQLSENWGVAPGTTDEDIILQTVTGGLFGHFINGETQEPITDTWDLGMMLRDLSTWMEYYSGPDENGYYEIYVPPGMYEIMAGGPNWNFMGYDTLSIGSDLIPFDIVLFPVDYDATLMGYIYDENGFPIAGADVQVGNDGWGTGMTTGPDGFYAFDLPSGFYYMHVWAPNYFEEFTEINIFPGMNQRDFYLESFQVDGVLTGYVFDAATNLPVADAMVYAQGEDFAYGYWTGEDGEFWFDLPNGIYTLMIEHPNYLPFWNDGYMIDNDTNYVEIGLMTPAGGLEGYIRDEMGNPIWDAQIVLFSLDDSLAFWGTSRDSGYYRVPAMNGQYEVFADAPGFDPAQLGTINIQDNWVWMDITLMMHQFATPPEINFIIDQPHDQGRQVRMQFWPGGTDWGPFMGFSVWRMTNTPNGPIMDFVDYLPNHDFDAYNLVLPTLVDSNAYTSPDQYITGFMVTGHWDYYGYIDGMPGAGYSVDNILPGIPGALVLQGSDESGVQLGWAESLDDDFQYFELHKSLHANFSDDIVMQTMEAHHMDTDVSAGATYYYKVMAVDANGNHSEATNVVSTSIVGLDDARPLPTSFALSQNYPNPFNPSTAIEFALPEASQVTLEIYNLLGQRVRTLVNGYYPAGYVTATWNGLDQNGQELSSGTYIYRLKAADQTFSQKMVLMK